MNIRTNQAGAVSHEHILSKGFEVFETMEGEDMGQMSWSIPQYRNEKCVIVGGYWDWEIRDSNSNKLFSGWWNSNEEFDITLKELGLLDE